MNSVFNPHYRQDCRILLTGALGFIGNTVLVDLKSRGLQVCAIDKYSMERKEVVTLDMVNTEALSLLISEFSPDILIHLGTNSAGNYEKNFIDSFQEDSIVLVNILKCVKTMPELRPEAVTQFCC